MAADAMPHLSDEALLLLADSELPAGDEQAARDHLRQCKECSTRLACLERLSTDLAATYHVNIWGTRAAKACAAVIMAACSLYWLAANGAPRPELTVAGLQMNVLPVRYLTPGATRQVTATELCGEARDEDRQNNDRQNIAPAMKHAVLWSYGVRGLPDRDYELDYLVTPELGGAADPQNLWPERYASATWNAHVKDDLEHLLHRLVCDGSVPLASAQHDIAADWIAAYKQYFRTDKPGGWAAALPRPLPIRE